MDDLIVRDAAEADMPAVQRIYAHHVLHGAASFEEEPPPLDELLRRRADVLARGLPYLVADRAGRVVGYSYAGPYRPRSAYRFTVEDSIYVDPELISRGVGTRLLGELIARCSKAGMREMVAIIGDRDPRSVALHARFGFRLVGQLEGVGRKFGRWVDTTLMQRRLSAGVE